MTGETPTGIEPDWFVAEDAVPDDGSDPSSAPWKVLIVDDDEQVHIVTRMVLRNLSYQQRRTLMLSAYSAAEARTLLRDHPDMAVILLDVVMETEDAGLALARHIRDELGNHAIRIILRTGQPGQAPERHVIDHYDINDYKTKSEMTADRLYTAAAAALRSYRHINALETSRRGLERIIDASASLLDQRSLADFVDAVVLHLRAMIPDAHRLLLCAQEHASDAITVIAGSGHHDGADPEPITPGRDLRDVLSPDRSRAVEVALRQRTTCFNGDYGIIVFPSRSRATRVAYLTYARPLDPIDRQLLEVFSDKVAIGFDNVYLHEQLLAAQRATVYALGKLAEYKDEVTGDHVRRIGSLARRIAERLRETGVYTDVIDDSFLHQIELASVLHDVGKIAIPDSILQKPGPLDPDQRRYMQKHAAVGGQLLSEAASLVDTPTYLSMGAEIAATHHERFDGQGYPQGLAGSDIPLSGRIVALADNFDALIHERQYKRAWPREQALALIREETGSHFDPAVVVAFLAVIGA